MCHVKAALRTRRTNDNTQVPTTKFIFNSRHSQFEECLFEQSSGKTAARSGPSIDPSSASSVCRVPKRFQCNKCAKNYMTSSLAHQARNHITPDTIGRCFLKAGIAKGPTTFEQLVNEELIDFTTDQLAARTDENGDHDDEENNAAAYEEHCEYMRPCFIFNPRFICSRPTKSSSPLGPSSQQHIMCTSTNTK